MASCKDKNKTPDVVTYCWACDSFDIHKNPDGSLYAETERGTLDTCKLSDVQVQKLQVSEFYLGKSASNISHYLTVICTKKQ